MILKHNTSIEAIPKQTQITAPKHKESPLNPVKLELQPLKYNTFFLNIYSYLYYLQIFAYVRKFVNGLVKEEMRASMALLGFLRLVNGK